MSIAVYHKMISTAAKMIEGRVKKVPNDGTLDAIE